MFIVCELHEAMGRVHQIKPASTGPGQRLGWAWGGVGGLQ